MIKKTTEQFIKEAKLIHGDEYDYSLVEYINNSTKIKIKCNSCGNTFEQLPRNHICLKQKCPFCHKSNKKTTEQFIEEARQIHGDKYDYSLVEYKGCKIKVKIICPKHGIFEQSFTEHVNREQRCPKCYNSKGEEKIRKLLQDKKNKFEEQKKFSDLKDKKSLSYDFYIPSKNLLIECNGEQHYKFNKCFHKNLHEFHRQLHHDWLKRKYAKDNNINLLVIPYWMISNLS